MVYRVLILLGVILLLLSCRVDFASAQETTTIPSWSTGTGYSECSEDVRVVVSPEPLKASDIKLLITSNYRFMTVIEYNGRFHWYFVRYQSCSSDLWYYDNDGFMWRVPEDFLYDGRGGN